jgi:hypothetical protein
MFPGAAQELRLVQHLRSQGYAEIVHGEEFVKRELGLPLGSGVKCADVLGYLPNKRAIGRIVIAESKGTNVATAVRQIGNAAAAVFERYGANRDTKLLLYTSAVRKLDIGLSPGPGYLLRNKDGQHLFVLLDATSVPSTTAHAQCELGAPWIRWNSKLYQMEIDVYVEHP